MKFPREICPSVMRCIIQQGLSQDLETGCLKLAIVKLLGVQNFKGGGLYTLISTINMYKLIKIRHDILIQCHVNYAMMKKFNYMLEIGLGSIGKTLSDRQSRKIDVQHERTSIAELDTPPSPYLYCFPYPQNTKEPTLFFKNFKTAALS